MKHEITIRSGKLELDIRKAACPPDNLVTYAARANPRRGFYFVSRIMGKHLPCRPYVMRNSFRMLAQLAAVQAREHTLVIGLGEAATGLGAGTAADLARRMGSNRLLYMFTTRHYPGSRSLLEFDESHSHARNHFLFQPLPQHREQFDATEHLVLVDDEVTSGRTVTVLARKLAACLGRIRRITVLSLISWLDEERMDAYRREFRGVNLEFHSLVAGSFHFEPKPDFRVALPANTEVGSSRLGARIDTGRAGMRPEESGPVFDPNMIVPQEPLLVLGNGEFMFQPFLLAEALEARGHDVMFLATTRTPLLVGDAIETRIDFPARKLDGPGLVNFLYNLPEGRRIISCYEDSTHAAQHDLGLPGQSLILPGQTTAQPQNLQETVLEVN